MTIYKSDIYALLKESNFVNLMTSVVEMQKSAELMLVMWFCYIHQYIIDLVIYHKLPDFRLVIYLRIGKYT